MIKKIFAATSKWPVEDLKKLKPHLVLVIEEVALLEREDLQIWNELKKYSVHCWATAGCGQEKIPEGIR